MVFGAEGAHSPPRLPRLIAVVLGTEKRLEADNVPLDRAGMISSLQLHGLMGKGPAFGGGTIIQGIPEFLRCDDGTIVAYCIV